MANVGSGLTWTFFENKWHKGNPPLLGARSHCLWLSSSVFDGARAFNGLIPDLEPHCARVIRSARLLGMAPMLTTEEIMDLENPVTAEVPAMNPLAEMDPQSGMDPLAEIDPMSETVSSPEDTLDLSEMDFGDIEITDLSESPEPSPEAEEMMQAADIEVKEEAPITSQAELGSVEEADIENLSEMQEQVLLNE